MHLIFARITKVDESTRTVTGRAAQEILDKDGEVFDYATSKEPFQRWSSEVFSDTRGLSHGNVRAMHSNVAAGILSDIDFNDAEKAVDIVATITDDQEWKKITSGTYSGFSIGGRYAKKWTEIMDGVLVTKYTAIPSEISIVDRPACPTANFFSVHKRDGTVEQRRFATNNFVDALNKFQSLLTENSMDKNASVDAIGKIHAQGPQSLPKDFLHKYEATGPRDRTEQTIRKLRGEMRGNHKIDLDAVFKIARRSAALRKATFPPQSRNAQWDNVTARTGATNDWNDEGTLGDTPKPTRIGGQVIGVPSKTNMQAAFDAIKQDLARGAKRMGI